METRQLQPETIRPEHPYIRTITQDQSQSCSLRPRKSLHYHLLELQFLLLNSSNNLLRQLLPEPLPHIRMKRPIIPNDSNSPQP